MVIALSLTACNRYALFFVQDGQDGIGNDADVLFVLDNSESMRDESVALAENFVRFVQAVAAHEADLAAIGNDGLEDAVAGYLAEAGFAGGFVDLQLGVTTIDAAITKGALLGDPPVLSGSDPDLQDAFVRTVLCEATCFVARADVPEDPEHQCEDGFTGTVSQQYLDCACGDGQWIGNCGASSEEGLESAYLALCRTDEGAPAACFESGGLLEEERNSSPGFHRPGATYLPIVITDEGDQSHRMSSVEAVPTVYGRLFTEFDTAITFAVIGPQLDDAFEVPCSPTVASWAVRRYDYMVDDTGGIKLPIHDEDCGSTDWSSALERLGALVNGATTAFELAQPAVPQSITVLVGNRPIEKSTVLGQDIFGQTVHSDGWSYDAKTHTLYLHGAAVPGAGERVEIWYLPDV